MRHAILLAVVLALPVPSSDAAPAGTGSRQAAAVRADDVAASGLETRIAEARAGLVDRLNALAAWCNGKQLFAERDRLWRRVLEIAPDDPTARKGLRYARNVDGSWKDPAPREVKNIGKQGLDELPQRELEAAAPYGDALLPLAQDEARTSAERERLLAEIRAYAPDHAGLHAWLGEVQMGDRWVIPETATAKERRAFLRAGAQAALAAGATLRTEQAYAEEKALGVEWRAVVQGPNVRVLSTGAEAEALQLARASEGAATMLAAGLGGEYAYPGGYTIYVLTAPGEKEAFLQHLPGVGAQDRERMMALEGTGLPQTRNVALFSTDPARRLDAAVRHTIGHLLSLNLAVEPRTGWAWEGIGLYLTRELVGTRLTWFVSEDADPATAGMRGKLMTPESNWIQEAFVVLTSPRPVPVAELLQRDLDQLGVGGALTAYALTAYLLEGRPDAAAEFVRRSAAREDPAVYSVELLDLTPIQLHERLVRWLSERR